MQKKYKYAVVLGRYQPPHIGHHALWLRGLEIAEKLIILVGSATGARRPRNPWTFDERRQMIEATGVKAWILPVRDFVYREDRWIESVQRAVYSVADISAPIALIGCNKDQSTYYLTRFPQWDFIDTWAKTEVDATSLRNKFFFHPGLVQDSAPGVERILREYEKTPEFLRMTDEYGFLQQYRLANDAHTYHRNNVTADAVVVQGGHVLMVRRKSHPGKGMLALPGGHVGKKELPLDAAIRELQEETKIKVPENVLRGSIVDRRWFDDPHRSDLARTYTHAVFMRLTNEGDKLAKVRGADDAEKAIWMPLARLNEEECFDDHWHIIDSFIGLA